ncbi:MAG TPA: RNA polymerase subunit sigma-24 [Bacteroidetes bacterium]|nr:RNA polymerase subunit sigma-24 [Bacteroidota bacterium]
MQTNTLTDHELVRQYQRGNEQALASLIQMHKQRIFTAIYMFVRDRYIAEDIFQETFIKIVQRLRDDAYHEEGKFLPWALRIANNLCIDYYRKTKRTPKVKVTTQDGKDIFSFMNFSDDGNAEQSMVRKEAHERVRKLVNLLPPEQKEVVVLRHYADLSFKEIADLTNVPVNTCLGRMRYALINIRRMMAEKKIAL